MSCSGTCWLLVEAWFQAKHEGFWMNSCQFMFPGVSFLVFSSFGFKFLASGFQGFMVRDACVSVLVGGAGSLLSGVK